MSSAEKEIVERFITGLQGLMLGMQQVDMSCMEAFGSISKRDFGLCIMLGKEEKMIMREVAEFLQVPMSTATGIVDKLIERGLVVRDYSPEDRRIVIVSLSREGTEIYQMLRERLFFYGTSILDNFHSDEQHQFVALMERACDCTAKMEKIL